jgi:hypothetical protein
VVPAENTLAEIKVTDGVVTPILDHVIIDVNVGPYTCVLTGNEYNTGKFIFCLVLYVKNETACLHDRPIVFALFKHTWFVVAKFPAAPLPVYPESYNISLAVTGVGSFVGAIVGDDVVGA